MSDQSTEQESTQTYHKISFYKFINNRPLLLDGQYLAEHQLRNSEFMTFLAELHSKFNNHQMIEIRIERKQKRIETTETHFELDYIEVSHL